MAFRQARIRVSPAARWSLLILTFIIFAGTNTVTAQSCCFSVNSMSTGSNPNVPEYQINITASHKDFKRNNQQYTALISFPPEYLIQGEPSSSSASFKCDRTTPSSFTCESHFDSKFSASFHVSMPTAILTQPTASVTIYGDTCEKEQYCSDLTVSAQSNNISLGPFGTWPKTAVIIAGIVLGSIILIAVYLLYRRSHPASRYLDTSEAPSFPDQGADKSGSAFQSGTLLNFSTADTPKKRKGLLKGFFPRNESSLNTEKTIDRSVAANNNVRQSVSDLGSGLSGSDYMPFSSVVVNMEENLRNSRRHPRKNETDTRDLDVSVPDVYDISQEKRTKSPTVPHSNTELYKSSSRRGQHVPGTYEADDSKADRRVSTLKTESDEHRMNRKVSTAKRGAHDSRVNKEASTLKTETDEHRANRKVSMAKRGADESRVNREASTLKTETDEHRANRKVSMAKRGADESRVNREASTSKREADESRASKRHPTLKTETDEHRANRRVSTLKTDTDESRVNRRSSMLKAETDENKANRRSMLKTDTDENKANRRSMLKTDTDESRANRKSSMLKTDTDESRANRKSSMLKTDTDESRASKRHSTLKTETDESRANRKSSMLKTETDKSRTSKRLSTLKIETDESKANRRPSLKSPSTLKEDGHTHTNVHSHHSHRDSDEPTNEVADVRRSRTTHTSSSNRASQPTHSKSMRSPHSRTSSRRETRDRPHSPPHSPPHNARGSNPHSEDEADSDEPLSDQLPLAMISGQTSPVGNLLSPLKESDADGDQRESGKKHVRERGEVSKSSIGPRSSILRSGKDEFRESTRDKDRKGYLDSASREVDQSDKVPSRKRTQQSRIGDPESVEVPSDDDVPIAKLKSVIK
ncbi:9782_t:CDS:2 [Paraglomus brasilianum]|uniref:9782_t:CDS:1 n=1 Tax=Paraglomus brasilianum TaxID=144538 RepID=A0A9N9FBE0_9GLOM|nr:9782_t:CDS:2 [Paraglomus brasilianum]